VLQPVQPFVHGERVCEEVVPRNTAVAILLLLRELMPLQGATLCRDARLSGAVLDGTDAQRADLCEVM